MGVLHNSRTSTSYTLSGRTLIGRGRGADLRLGEPGVSSEHAVVFYGPDGWQVRDLASRNGTFVDGARVEAGLSVPLARGAAVGFGDPNTDWRLASDGPPVPVATGVESGIVRVGSADLLALPRDEDPQVTLLRGVDGGWVAERDQGTAPAYDQDVLVVDGEAWRLGLPAAQAQTQEHDAPPCSVVDVRLRFSVSLDEESVRMTVVLPDGVEHALRPRSWQFLLLHLGRMRLADEAPATEAGWTYIDELTRGLQLNAGTLRLHVHRARQSLAELGVQDAASLIERRPQAQQLRVGTSRVEVVREG